ncbi:MAG: hypothetical protein J5636_04600 [Clostridiales bacterium]|nr:hypothetical protein [Clostridiales bacterium]
MLFIVCALHCEAKPVIETLGLKRDRSSNAFEIYSSDRYCLIVSGMGVIHASSAVTYLLTKNRFDNHTDMLINFGSCAGKEPGLYLINKITDSATGRDYYPDLIYDLSSYGLPITSERALVTSYQVVSGLEDPDTLYEMEAAAVFSAASRFVSPHRMVFLKFVSDQGVDDPKKITSEYLTECASSYTPALLEVFGALSLMVEPVTSFDEALFEKTCEELCASETMKHQLRNLFTYAEVSGQDLAVLLSSLHEEGKLPTNSKREGKVVLDEIRNQLL